MSTSSRRQRSMTSMSTPPPITESASAIQLSLEQLSSTLQTSSESQTSLLSKVSPQVRTLRQCLARAPGSARPKDTFRHLHGFSCLLDALRAASGYYHPHKRTEGEKEKLFELLGDILGLLADVFRDHHGNRRYFKKRVEGGGWVALEQAIASIGFGGSEPDTGSENRLFGLLLAFAVDDEKLQSICQDLQDHGEFDESNVAPHIQTEAAIAKVPVDNIGTPPVSIPEMVQAGFKSPSTGDIAFAASMERAVQSALEQTTLLVNKDIAPTIVGFWKALSRDRHLSDAPAALSVILILSKICSFSKFNLLGLHSTGVLATFLPLALENDASLFVCERTAVEKLCIFLMSLGVNSLDDARYLLLSKSPAAAEFLLQTIKSSQSPPHIQFDLSLNGFASIELPTLGRQFPPPSSVAGYTFTAWIHIDRFDNKAHTTIFGAFDSSQTCFVLAYLERDTHNFILQTSVTSSRPSVRFKSTRFQERRWYHIAIVHRRPRTITSSKAALYVNGEFAEQVKCLYPASPPPTNSSTDSLASFTSSSSVKSNPVQAFLGTPQDLSTQLGKGAILSCWSLASAHLFEDTLSDDLLAVHYRLGPRYNGNFQDCLGSFQTYEASAGLGMRNELMHPGKDEKSDILTAIREKASTLMPESRVLLGVLPSAVMGDETRGEGEPVQLIRGLSRTASNNLFQLTRNGTSVAVNAAVPSINEALNRANGTAILTGDPVVIIPRSIDDAMWRLGGCVAICLKVVEDATTREDIVRAVEILFESVRGNWRNSEAMEQENGYSILGALIRGKIGSGTVIASTNAAKSNPSNLNSTELERLSFQLLSLVLGFLGYNHGRPEDSVINNPLAYRILLVDFDMWRKTAVITQRLYYKQFITFGVSSKYHLFNSRRLLRMRRYPSGTLTTWN
jgi:beige protein homolog 1